MTQLQPRWIPSNSGSPRTLTRALSRRSFLRTATTLALATTTAHARPADPRTANDYDMTPAQFRNSPDAGREIDWRNPGLDLIAAAIFHETNRRRLAAKRPALKHSVDAATAARWQSEVMARERFLDHENPVDPGLRTLDDRVRRAGLKIRMASENVALAFALRYEAGREFFTRKGRGGRPEFSYTEKGSVIRMHSPLSFATALLDQWMDSPGHRENILSTEPTHLGCHAAPATNDLEMPVFYATQVFFAPQKAQG